MRHRPDASVSTIIQEDNNSAYFTQLRRRPDEMPFTPCLARAKHSKCAYYALGRDNNRRVGFNGGKLAGRQTGGVHRSRLKG